MSDCGISSHQSHKNKMEQRIHGDKYSISKGNTSQKVLSALQELARKIIDGDKCNISHLGKSNLNYSLRITSDSSSESPGEFDKATTPQDPSQRFSMSEVGTRTLFLINPLGIFMVGCLRTMFQKKPMNFHGLFPGDGELTTWQQRDQVNTTYKYV